MPTCVHTCVHVRHGGAGPVGPYLGKFLKKVSKEAHMGIKLNTYIVLYHKSLLLDCKHHLQNYIYKIIAFLQRNQLVPLKIMHWVSHF